MAKQSTVTRGPGAIPNVPVYTVGGVKQPPGFSAGAWHTLKVMRTIESAKDAAIAADARDWSMHVTEALLPKLIAIANRGDHHCNGVIAALFSNFCESEVGGDDPNMALWTPLHPAWEGDNCEIPPEGCMFYEVDGVPYSVDESLSASEWDSQTSGTAVNVDTIRGKAKPITRAKFESMRWRLGSKAKEAEAVDRGEPVGADHDC